MNSSPSSPAPGKTFERAGVKHLLSRITNLPAPLIAALAGIALTLPAAATAAPKQILCRQAIPTGHCSQHNARSPSTTANRSEPARSCPARRAAGPQLPRQTLAGAFVPFGNVAGANLAGSSLAGSFIPHTNFRGADLSGVSLVGTTPAYADFRGADMANDALTFSGFTSTDLRGANLRRALT